MTRHDPFDTPTPRHWELAEQAYNAGEDESVAAHAAIVAGRAAIIAVDQTSGILQTLEQLTEAIGGATKPAWTMFRDTDATPFTCTCGHTAFSEYPLRPEQELTWWVCDNPDCDAIWMDLETDGYPHLVSGGVNDFNTDPPWNIHDLVRHRPTNGVGQNVNRPIEYVAMLQTRDTDSPGWWNATVLRVVNPPAHTSPPLVGQGIRLREGTSVNRVARFP